MKLFQKMSSRDRSLLILLLAVVVFYLCYTFVISPQLAAAEVLKSNLITVQDELARAEELSGKTAELKTTEKNQKNELIKKYSEFLFDIDQNRILNKMDAIHTAVGLQAAQYQPTPEIATQVPVETGAYADPQYPLKDLALKINPELLPVVQDGNQTMPASPAQPPSENGASAEGEQAAPAPAEGVASSDMVLATDVIVGFSGASYESIYNFISTVEKLNKTVVLKNLTITKDEAGLTGQMVYSFYSLPKLDPKQTDGFEYTLTIPQGKTNPFM